MPINSFDNYPMSWKPQLEHQPHPLYIALAAHLEEDIKTGKLLPGTKLPPQRELADYLDINVSTVSRALKRCAQKGLLSGTVGSGTFVSYDALACFNMLPIQSDSLIEMGSMFPECKSYDELSNILKKMFAEEDFGRFFYYGSTEGPLWQREAAVKLIRRMGYDTTADRLLPAAGGQNSLTAVLAGLFNAGDCIGVDPLTYPGIKSAANMLSLKLVPISQRDGEIAEEGLLNACKNDRIKGIYIIPEFHNPTAHTMSMPCRKMIARIAIERDLIVIEDSIFSLFHDKPFKAVATYAPEQTIYLASFSKSIAPGLRLAYLAIPPRYHKALSDALYNINLIVSPLLLELAGRALASGKAEQLAANQRESARKRNKIVDAILSDYTLKGPNVSIFRWLILPAKWRTGLEFEAAACKVGVQVYGAERFAVGNAKPPAAVRLAISTITDVEDLKTGLYLLKKLLEQPQ